MIKRRGIVLLIILSCLISLCSCNGIEEDVEYLRLMDEIEFLEEQLSDVEEDLVDATTLNAQFEEELVQCKEDYIALEAVIDEMVQEEETLPKIFYDTFPTPSDSGLRIYTGDIGVRSYPSEEAFVVFPVEQMDSMYLNCIATVATGSNESWGVVLANDWGRTKIGYVPYTELERYDPEYVLSKESLGGVYIGDRIEKMIGLINRDYYVLSDLVAIYSFPKYIYGTVDDELFKENDEIECFVTNDFHISYLRTSSIEFELSSGFAVGDNAIETFNYYEDNYESSEYEAYAAWGMYTFEISEGEYLSFDIDSPELTGDARISRIYLQKALSQPGE